MIKGQRLGFRCLWPSEGWIGERGGSCVFQLPQLFGSALEAERVQCSERKRRTIAATEQIQSNARMQSSWNWIFSTVFHSETIPWTSPPSEYSDAAVGLG